MSTLGRPRQPAVPANESDLEEWLRRARIAETACKEFDTRWFDTIDAKVLELLQVERELRSLDLIGIPSDKVPNATQLQRITFIPAVDVVHPGLVDSINAFRHFIDDELAICDERLAKKGRTRPDVHGYRSPEALDFGAPEPGYRGEKPQTAGENVPVCRDNRSGGRRLGKQPGSRRGPPLDPDEDGWSIVTTRTTNGPKHNRRGRRYQPLDRANCPAPESPPRRTEGPPKTPKYELHVETTARETSATASDERRTKHLVALKRPDDGGQLERLWAPDKLDVESYSEMLQKDKDLRYAEMLRKEKELQYGQVQLLQSPQSAQIVTTTPYADATPVKTTDQWPPISPSKPGGEATWLQTGAGNLPESTVVKDFAYIQSAAKEDNKYSTPTGAPPCSTATKTDQSSTATETQQWRSQERWTECRLPWKIAHRRVCGMDPPSSPSVCRLLRGSDATPAMKHENNPSTVALTTANSVLDALASASTNNMRRTSPPNPIPVSNWADEVELDEMSTLRPQQTPDSPSQSVRSRYVSSPLRCVELAQQSTTTNADSQTFATEYTWFTGQPGTNTARSPVETKNASTQTFAMHGMHSDDRKSPVNCQSFVSTTSPSVNYVSNNPQMQDSARQRQQGPHVHPGHSSHLDLVDSITRQYIQGIFGRSSTPLDYCRPRNYLSQTQTHSGVDGMPTSHTTNSKVHAATNKQDVQFRNLIQNPKMPDEPDVEQFAHPIPRVENTADAAKKAQHYHAHHQETRAIEPGSPAQECPQQYRHLQGFQHRLSTVPAHAQSAGGQETYDTLFMADENSKTTPAPQHWPRERHEHAPLLAITNRVEKQNQHLCDLGDVKEQHLPRGVDIDTKDQPENVFDIPGDSTAMHDPPANGLPRLETSAQTRRAFGGMQLMIVELVRSERNTGAEQEAADPERTLKSQQVEWDARMAARWEHLIIEGGTGAVNGRAGGSLERHHPVGLVVHRPVVSFKVKWRLHGRWCDWVETRRFVIQKETMGGRRVISSLERDS